MTADPRPNQESGIRRQESGRTGVSSLTPDPCPLTPGKDPRPVRELLDHCAASLERLGVALRRGLHPAALAECAAQLTGIREGLGRLAETMARRALEEPHE